MLSDNASSVESTREGDQHGLLFITQEPNAYHFLTGHVFMEPTIPGPTPVVPGGVRTQQEEAIKSTHKENLRTYKEHRTVSQALIKQLIFFLNRSTSVISRTYARGTTPGQSKKYSVTSKSCTKTLLHKMSKTMKTK